MGKVQGRVRWWGASHAFPNASAMISPVPTATMLVVKASLHIVYDLHHPLFIYVSACVQNVRYVVVADASLVFRRVEVLTATKGRNGGIGL